MRILYLSHYFHPEGNAPATRVYEMGRRWVAEGHEVTVVTGVPNVPNGVPYPGYRNRWRQHETVEGIDVVRVWTYLAPNKGTVRRIANYLSFLGSATWAALWLPRPDVVIATSPQFFCGFAGVLVSGLRRLPFVLEIRDIWPESIATVGAMQSGLLHRVLEWLERRRYRAADHVVTVGQGYRAQLEERRVPREKISIVPNGVDRRRFRTEGRGEALRAELGLGDAFVCSYVGTIGMASGLDVVLRAARLLRDRGRDDVVFLLVGDGAIREELEARARAEGLGPVRFTGRQDKSRIPDFLQATDACLVHLAKRDLFRSVMPSKIFEAAAAARPIVLGVEGHAADFVRAAEAGLCIEPENEEELVTAVCRLADDPALREKLGRSGLERIATRFDYDALAGRYLQVLEATRRGGAEG